MAAESAEGGVGGTSLSRSTPRTQRRLTTEVASYSADSGDQVTWEQNHRSLELGWFKFEHWVKSQLHLFPVTVISDISYLGYPQFSFV